MKFLKKLFKKKEVVKVKPIEIEEEVNPNLCQFCKEQIYDKGKKFDGKRYHIKCFRKLKKQSAKALFQS